LQARRSPLGLAPPRAEEGLRRGLRPRHREHRSAALADRHFIALMPRPGSYLTGPASSKTLPPRAGSSRSRALLVVLLALGVALGVFAWARAITPDYTARLFGQSASDTFPLKSWMASGVAALALFQLFSALWIYGELGPARRPRWLGTAHRLSGAAAILISLPIARHCLLAYGFRSLDARTLIHSAAGCFFYGAVAAKLTAVRSRRLPGIALPIAGGTLVTLVAALWYTSALWYFNGFELPVP
jgi:Family of unknown function (DUF6529)